MRMVHKNVNRATMLNLNANTKRERVIREMRVTTHLTKVRIHKKKNLNRMCALFVCANKCDMHGQKKRQSQTCRRLNKVKQKYTRKVSEREILKARYLHERNTYRKIKAAIDKYDETYMK